MRRREILSIAHTPSVSGRVFASFCGINSAHASGFLFLLRWFPPFGKVVVGYPNGSEEMARPGDRLGAVVYTS